MAENLGLHALPLHAHEVCLVVGLYIFIAQVISPLASARLFPHAYANFDSRTRIGWNVHVVSFVPSCIVNILSFYIILFDEERKTWAGAGNWEKRVGGYTGLIGFTQSVALGYFLWNFYMCLRHLHIFWVEYARTRWRYLRHVRTRFRTFNTHIRINLR